MKHLAYLLGVLLCASTSTAAPAPQARDKPTPPARIKLRPQFVPGRVLRYHMEFRSTTEGQRSGLVVDPQAPTRLEVTWSAVVKVEVLSATSEATRLRTTYEKSTATARSDTFDPEAAEIEEQYHRLEGHSIEFSLDAEAKIGEVRGLQEILGDSKTASAARDSLAQLAGSTSLPREGIAPGLKWSSRQSAANAPLAGVVMRTESTYLRDERCRPDEPAGPRNPLALETCAVILTRFAMSQPHAPRDPTPEEYRKNGLRTAGKWRGSGESLTYVSLRSGWVVSVTQSGEQDMDVTVSTRQSGSSLRYAGHVRSQSQISLLPDVPAERPQAR